MKVAIIDAEIIGKRKHRFPNLCCMKLSAYHKSIGDQVELKLDYESLETFQTVYISKVFTKTDVPKDVLTMGNVRYGGTGFFYDKAPPLPDCIEHIKPDYSLYSEWVEEKIKQGTKRLEFTFYLDYSIGYLTRGCFRGCEFCVNKNCKQSSPASSLEEFIDESRPKLCFLDDNFFACPKWKELIQPVIHSGKRFQFKQGLDERLLSKEKIAELSKWNYDREIRFAFDNIEDKEIIISKLLLIKETAPSWKRELKFYVFCGWDKQGKYDDEFWKNDIKNLFERIKILKTFNALPYVMRFEKVYTSEYSSFYATVAAWCNQPSMFRSTTFRIFSKLRGMSTKWCKTYKRDIDTYLKDIGIKGIAWREMERVEKMFPDIAEKYYDFNGKSVSETEWLNNLLD